MNTLTKRHINFKKMTNFISKKKKSIIIVFIVGILIGAVFSVASKKAIVMNTENSALAEVQTAKKSLSSSEASYVDSAYNTYTKLVKKKNQYDDYEENSILLNLNTETSAGVELTYYISGNKKATNIKNNYKASLVNDNLAKTISSKFSDKPKITYVKELIDFKSEENSSDNTVILENNSSNNDASETMTISIWARNSSELKIMEDAVKARINQLKTKYEATYGDFNLKLADESSDRITDTELSNFQNKVDSDLSTTVNLITSVQNSLSETERNYFNVLVAAGKSAQSNSKPASTVSVKLVATYGIGIGLIILILYVIVLIVRYLMSNRLHYALEMEHLYGINLITEMNKNHDFENVKKEFEYFMNHEDGVIGITSSSDSDEVKEVLRKLSDLDHVVLLAAEPKADEDFEKLNKGSGIVLIEKDEESDVRKINEIIDYYKKKNIQVKGSIVID